MYLVGVVETETPQIAETGAIIRTSANKKN
jgi:hypothetical protein